MDTSRPGPANCRMRFHSGALGETTTLPLTSEGQKGAVAVVGNPHMSVQYHLASPSGRFLKRFMVHMYWLG